MGGAYTPNTVVKRTHYQVLFDNGFSQAEAPTLSRATQNENVKVTPGAWPKWDNIFSLI